MKVMVKNEHAIFIADKIFLLCYLSKEKNTNFFNKIMQNLHNLEKTLLYYRWINCIAVIAPKKKIVGTAKAWTASQRTVKIG